MILISPVLKASGLFDILKNDDLVIMDASTGPDAAIQYASRHLEGALFIDLNKQLAAVKDNAGDGGRHPLPAIEKFSETLGVFGISPETHVLIYDNKNGSNAAARFWWMLRAIGHTKVQVLSGGITAAENAGLKLTDSFSKPKEKAPYPVTTWRLPRADMETVREKAGHQHYIVIDVRDAERYLGEKEPIDLVAGHIPGAINIPFTANLNAFDEFLSPQVLKEKYQSVFDSVPAENIIVHCGSGVTACHTLLAMAHAGFDIPALYVGSWSEWSRNNNPIATGDK